jgi:hypothetical protein
MKKFDIFFMYRRTARTCTGCHRRVVCGGGAWRSGVGVVAGVGDM